MSGAASPNSGSAGEARRRGETSFKGVGNWKLWTRHEDLKLTELCKSEVQRSGKSARVTVVWARVHEKFNEAIRWKRTQKSLESRWRALKRGRDAQVEDRPSACSLDPELAEREVNRSENEERERSSDSRGGEPVRRDPNPANCVEESDEESLSDESFYSCLGLEAESEVAREEPSAGASGNEDCIYLQLMGLPIECVQNKASLKVLLETTQVTPSGEMEAKFLRVFRKVSRKDVQRDPIETPRGSIQVLAEIDTLIQKYLYARGNSKVDMPRLNALVYAGAAVAAADVRARREAALNGKVSNQSYLVVKETARRAITRKLGLLTSEANRRHEKRVPTVRERRNLRKIVHFCKSHETEAIKVEIERLKQRLAVVQNEIKTKKAEMERSRLRASFAHTPSVRILNKESVVGDRPSQAVTDEYWRTLLGTERKPNLKNKVLQSIGKELSLEYGKQVSSLSKEKVLHWYNEVLRKVHSRKAPGPDGIRSTWWLKFPTVRAALFKWICAILCGKARITKTDAAGRTVMLFKSGDASKPENYRPIACLNTYFKVLTAVLARWTEEHVRKGSFFPEMQRAVRKGEQGCLHASLTDQAVALAAEVGKVGLCTAWIDFAKAFDSVPHRFIKWLLFNLNMPPNLRAVIGRVLDRSTTRIQMGKQLGQPINVRSGVMQGDSLSPYLFCVAVAAISKALEKSSKVVFQTTDGAIELNHQYFVDDLKLYATTPGGLWNALRVTENVVDAIGMKINEAKCAVAFNGHVIKGSGKRERLLQRFPLVGPTGYKYLGIRQQFAVCDATQCDDLRKKSLGTVEKILRSDLTFGQKRKLINSVVIPSIKFTYENIHWGSKSLAALKDSARALDTEIRKRLVEHKWRYKSSSVERLYLEVHEGGLGLKSAEETLKEARVSAGLYLAMHEKLGGVSKVLECLKYKSGKKVRTPLKDLTEVSESCGIRVELILGERCVKVDGIVYNELSKARSQVIKMVRQHRTEKRLSVWENLACAGVVRKLTGVDWKATSLLFAKGWLSADNGRNIVGLQENCAHKSFVGNDTCIEKCRLCRRCDISSQHLVSNCQAITETLYVDRHDNVALHIWNLFARKYQLPIASRKTKPATRLENTRVVLWWNARFEFDAPIKHRQPDIVVMDLERKTIKVIEIAVSWSQNISRQIRLKTNRYAVNSEDLGAAEFNEEYPPSPRNFVRLLKLKHPGFDVKLYVVVVGACGEILTETSQVLKDLNEGGPIGRYRELVENLSRSAALGSSRIWKIYCSSR